MTVLRVVTFIVCWCWAASGLAESEIESDAIEEIVVIGSRLARPEFSAPSPIVALDSEELKLAGIGTLEDALNALPQVVPDAARTDPQIGGLSAVNLRGLGVNRTLVMLNGHRLAPARVDGAVDLNAIPASLIDRVEVVTGGASAVYGSDAVVGIVNVVLDDRFDGLELSGRYEITDHGDGEIADLGLSAGTSFAGGRGHVSGFVNLYDRNPILLADRAFTAIPIGDNPETGELFESGEFTVPQGAIFFPPALIDGQVVGSVIFEPDGTLRGFIDPNDRYNAASDNNNQTPLERQVAAGFVEWRFSEGVRGGVEALYARNELNQQLASASFFGFAGATVDNPFLPPETRAVFRGSYDFDEDGIADFFLVRRITEIGPRIVQHRRDTVRLRADLSGEIGRWGWEVSYAYSDVDTDEIAANVVSEARFRQGLLIDPAAGACLDPSGGCVPINIYGAGNLSREALDFLRIGPVENDERAEQQVATAAITGELPGLPAGPIRTAFGGEWRELTVRFTPDPGLADDDVVGFNNFDPAVGTIRVGEAFGEVLVPLIADPESGRYLGVEAGARLSDYNTSGRLWTWKLGIEAVPLERVRFRAMWQRASRAPNALELFEVASEGFGDASPDVDLCSASNDPLGNGLSDLCIAQGLDPALVGTFMAGDNDFAVVSAGGNPGLEPEDSDSITLGVVVRSIEPGRFSASLDYFDIDIDGAVTTVDFETALAACFASGDPDSEFCEGLVRNDAGSLVAGIEIPRNIAELRSEGIDLHLKYGIDTPGLALFDGDARVVWALYATWYFTNGGRTAPFTPLLDCAGHFGEACALSSFGTLPDFKSSARMTYHSGPLAASLRWRWISGMDNSVSLAAEVFDLPPPVLAIPEIGDRSYFDLSARYRITERFELNAGIVNLLDNDPPLLASQAPGFNTDPSTYDVIGRRYFLGGTYRF